MTKSEQEAFDHLTYLNAAVNMDIEYDLMKLQVYSARMDGILSGLRSLFRFIRQEKLGMKKIIALEKLITKDKRNAGLFFHDNIVIWFMKNDKGELEARFMKCFVGQEGKRGVKDMENGDIYIWGCEGKVNRNPQNEVLENLFCRLH